MPVTIGAVCEAIGAPLAAKDWAPRMDAWASLYRCEHPEIKITLSDGEHKRSMRTLGMGKTVCEDWAGLLWTEAAEVVAGEDESAEAEVLGSLFGERFAPRFTEHLEREVFARGFGALELLPADLVVSESGVVTPSADTKLYVDTIPAEAIVPLSWSRGEVVEVAFFDVDGKVVNVREHRIEGGQRIIAFRRFDVQGRKLVEQSPEDLIAQGFIPRLQLADGAPAFFACERPALANHIDGRAPFGISVLDKAADHLYAVDLAFDNMTNDIDLGTKMVFVPDTMLRKDPATGKLIPPQKEKRSLFVALEDASGGDGKLHEHNPDLRVEDNERAINVGLSLLSAAVGMGQERYRYRGEAIATATQVISENSDLFRNRRKHMLAVTDAVTRIARAALWAAKNLCALDVDPEAEVVIRSDDSVIEDDGTRIARGLTLFSSGAISRFRFLTEYMGLSEDEARAEIAEDAAAAPQLF